MKRIDDIPKELLLSLYYGNDFDLREIAGVFGCSRPTVTDRMNEYDIPLRNSGIRECKLSDFMFTGNKLSIFNGCMLGDGCLHKRRDRRNCNFCYGDIHKDFLFWLQKELGIIDVSSIRKAHYGYMLRTKVSTSLKDEHYRWYGNSTPTFFNRCYKKIPNDIKLDLTSALFWYIGDGTYSKRDRSGMFCNTLDLLTAQHLLKQLLCILDLDSYITVCCHLGDYMIRFGMLATKRFFSMIKDLNFDVPKCYWYKFGIPKDDYNKYNTFMEALDVCYG